MFHRILLLLLCLFALLPLHAAVPRGTDLSRLNKGSAEERYREREFCAYKPLRQLWDTYKLGQYSSYENPTGIYYKKGESISIILHNEPAAPVRLIIRDFMQGGTRDSYELRKGVNVIRVKNKGLGYIDYRHADGCAAPTISVRLRGGTINGIFSRHDDTSTWEELLDHATAGTLDMVGERCQLAFTVEGLRKGAGSRGVELLETFDATCQEMRGGVKRCEKG